jgi:hypothetical protein
VAHSDPVEHRRADHSSTGDLPRLEYYMPDSPLQSRQRTAWRVLAALGCILGATALVVSALLSNGIKKATKHQEKAVCAVVRYAEQQSDVLRVRSPDASRNLDKLVVRMRSTGIHCPPKSE